MHSSDGQQGDARLPHQRFLVQVEQSLPGAKTKVLIHTSRSIACTHGTSGIKGPIVGRGLINIATGRRGTSAATVQVAQAHGPYPRKKGRWGLVRTRVHLS